MESKRLVFVIISLLVTLLTTAAAGQESGPLPQLVLIQLMQLEETYRILDEVSGKIWPDWKDYRAVPFLFEYDNGLRVLIGHPNPPREFQAVSGLRVGESRIFADRSRLVAKPLVPPLAAGGGPIGFGSNADGSSVQVVDMKFVPASQMEAEANTQGSTEDQLLIYIHELFHCFQRAHLKNRVYGNLQINADAHYALYSEIEGLALHRAYVEPDSDKAKALIKQFLVARSLKRATMSELQRNQESTDEFSEGTATYSEVRTLEALKSGGYRPGLSTDQDPEYHGFRNVDELLRRYPDRLLKSAHDVEYPYGKSYTYGCFQALLSQRLFAGWQEFRGFRIRFHRQRVGAASADRIRGEKRDRAQAPS